MQSGKTTLQSAVRTNLPTFYHHGQAPSGPSAPPNMQFGSDRPHLRDISHLWHRFEDQCRLQITYMSADQAESQLNLLAEQVASTTASLSAEKVSGPADAKTKLAAALLQRKRRAWSDLLKHLKTLGFTTNPSQAAIAIQQDPVFLHGHSRIPEVLITADAGESIRDYASLQRYFNKVLLLLPRVATASNTFNDDLKPQDVRRAIGLVRSTIGSVFQVSRLDALCLFSQH